jgi:hypothetical protein
MDDEGYVCYVYATSFLFSLWLYTHPCFDFATLFRPCSDDTLPFVPLNRPEPSRRLFISAFSVFLSHVMRLDCILGNGNELVVSFISWMVDTRATSFILHPTFAAVHTYLASNREPIMNKT